MTLREYLLAKYHAEAAWPTLEDSELWEAAKTDMREEAVCWAVEYALHRLTVETEWPESWRAKFPDIKAQALLDAKAALPIE